MSIPRSIHSSLNLFPMVRIDGTLFLDYWNSYTITEEFKLKTQDTIYYLVSPRDRWDLIAQQLYDDRSLWWLIVLFNDIEDPFSIYFDVDIDSSIKKLKIIRKENLGSLLNSIRDHILKCERARLTEEELNNKK